MATIVHLWSCPRAMSTSLMYAFAQHPQVDRVLDEPLYAHYLHHAKVERPYLDLVFKAQSKDGDQVVLDQLLPESPANIPLNGPSKKFVFVKHIAKQRAFLQTETWSRLLDMDYKGDRPRVYHILLVRDPYWILQSFHKVLGLKGATLVETALPELLDISSSIRNRTGADPVVIMSEDLQADPKRILQAVCEKIHLPWDERMLSWPEGPKPYDGIWAPWWYSRTHKTTGFESENASTNYKPFPPELTPVLEECRPFFDFFQTKRISPIALPTAVPVEDGKFGSHKHEVDERNKNILIGMRDGTSGDGRLELVWRPSAKVSVFDSNFMLGDGVWEGIRLHEGVLVFIWEHIGRLYEGAKALDMKIDLTPQKLIRWIYDTIDANGMQKASGVHIRLMVSRGTKPTPYQHPETTLGRPTIIIVPEWKELTDDVSRAGLRLYTVYGRRSRPDTQDPMWNSHSKLNCIQACIQAYKAGADEALMLDPHGFVATCNSTNFFIVRRVPRTMGTTINSAEDYEVWAPTPKYQLHGVTRAAVIQLCKASGIAVYEKDFTVTEVYSADEVFVTGTFAGLIPVASVDGRQIGSGQRPIIDKLKQLYRDLVVKEVALGRQY